MPTCAYCGEVAPKLTKEHLWPASLHRRINESNRSIYGEDNQFYLGKIDKMIEAEPQVRDVCSECNNGPLSVLDGYICQLWDQYFHYIVPAGAQIAFAFDYHLLTRWLLKMSFNSARISGNGLKHLENCREYILRGGLPPSYVAVHLQLLVPSDLDDEQLAVYRAHGVTETEYTPRDNRVGHFGYETRFGYGRLVRTVFLQSFLFLIHLFPDHVDQHHRTAELKDFAVRFPYAKRLRPKTGPTSTTLICAGFDALQSMTAHLENNQSIQAAKRKSAAPQKHSPRRQGI